MAMPKADDLPAVPDGPTATADAAPTPPADKKAKGKEPDAGGTGGRRPYDDILAELKALEPRVAELRSALAPLAGIPDDPRKPADAVLYHLVREGREQTITCADIRKARQALGML